AEETSSDRGLDGGPVHVVRLLRAPDRSGRPRDRAHARPERAVDRGAECERSAERAAAERDHAIADAECLDERGDEAFGEREIGGALVAIPAGHAIRAARGIAHHRWRDARRVALTREIDGDDAEAARRELARDDLDFFEARAEPMEKHDGAALR